MPWLRLVVACAVLSLGSTLLDVSPVAAVPITTLYTFSAANFSTFPAAVAPTNPVTGSVSVTFDPTDSTFAVVVNRIALTIAGHPYTLAEVGATYNTANDSLVVGGVLSGVGGVNGRTTDFSLSVNNAATPT